MILSATSDRITLFWIILLIFKLIYFFVSFQKADVESNMYYIKSLSNQVNFKYNSTFWYQYCLVG